MNKKEVRHPDKIVNTGVYSAPISCNGWLYVSGHASLDLKTGYVISGSVGEETCRTLESIGKILQQAGCTFDSVVKCTCYLANINDFNKFNEAYVTFFPGTPSERTTVQAVLWSNLKVELDAIARLPSKQD